ncbi:DUF4083 domain-containing protein [Rossellomorea aquimaris]|uniref:DUF4083 domain-containing protein n=1 Tax=Rossellomorea aquimaris TaxID=189382 RepID=UPI001CD6BDC6|nr:DUF4083 domain-containing protein [Rossellomorea aquimaris]MCA1060176.1 DUF4083 domain-containing protein [Rossellomorea aquimaris]
MYLGDVIFQMLVILLLLVGALSFTLFIRRIVVNSKSSHYASNEMNKKLDRIIDLLEKQNQKEE